MRSEDGYDDMLGAVPRCWRYEFLEASVAEPAPRLLEREGHARGDPQGDEQGVPVRRRTRPAGRRDRRRRRALPPLRRLGRAQARHGRATASIETRSTRSSSSITSRTRPTAAPAGRGRSARAAAITRRTRATARRRGRTCTTATGSAAGPTSVCRSTASLRRGTRHSWRSSTQPMPAERSAADGERCRA